jgi:hypothetical protein
MKGVRERVAARLEPNPPLPAIEAAPLPDDLVRLHERVREMVQDATRKGERVSAAAERSSRSAERFMRRLEEELHEVEGLVVRLGPADAPPPEARGTGSAPAAGRPRTGSLRLLEPGARPPAKEGSAAERAEPEPDDREEHS